MLAVIDKY